MERVTVQVQEMVAEQETVQAVIKEAEESNPSLN